MAIWRAKRHEIDHIDHADPQLRGIRRSSLLREDEVITVRTGHPLTCGRLTKAQLLEFPRIVVEPTGTMDTATDGFPDEGGNGKRVSVESAWYEFQHERIGPAGLAVVCVPSFASVVPFLQSFANG